jgi:hypothetical protein
MTTGYHNHPIKIAVGKNQICVVFQSYKPSSTDIRSSHRRLLKALDFDTFDVSKSKTGQKHFCQQSCCIRPKKNCVIRVTRPSLFYPADPAKFFFIYFKKKNYSAQVLPPLPNLVMATFPNVQIQCVLCLWSDFNLILRQGESTEANNWRREKKNKKARTTYQLYFFWLCYPNYTYFLIWPIFDQNLSLTSTIGCGPKKNYSSMETF